MKLTFDVVLDDFFKAIELVETPEIKKFVFEGFNMISEEFWMVPTSSSGRYHPPESNITPMGLMVHCVKACYYAKGMFNFFGVDEQIDKDIIIGALLLHDSYKGGWTDDWDSMIPEHGYIAVSYLAELELEPAYIKNKLMKAIETHMSRYARPFSSVTRFLFPEMTQFLVALSDMTVSLPKMSWYPGISVLDVE